MGSMSSDHATAADPDQRTSVTPYGWEGTSATVSSDSGEQPFAQRPPSFSIARRLTAKTRGEDHRNHVVRDIMFKKIHIRSYEVGLKFRDGEFAGLLGPGKRYIFTRFGKN